MTAGTQPAPTGILAAVKIVGHLRSTDGLVRDDVNGHYYRWRKKYLHEQKRYGTPWQYKFLVFLRDHVNRDIPRWWYNLVLGHDLHISTYARLYIKHYHTSERDPFNSSKIGWWENVGLVAERKVTTAHRNFEIDNMVAETAEFGDQKFHRVGTSAQAESNADTALIVDAGITGVAGTQVDATPIYRSVATVTADATETWQEHGIFTQAGTATPAGTLVDRNLISPTVAVVNLDTVQFTYEMTKNAEA